jgi:hypothetical protein
VPNKSQIDNLADEYGLTVRKVKELEKESEDLVEYDKDSTEFHGTVYKILVNKIKKHKSIASMTKFCLEVWCV